MILRYLGRRDWIPVIACVAFIVCQVYFDLRIPEYMSEITDHIQMGMGSDIVARDGLAMVVCSLLSLAASLCAGAMSARTAACLSRNLRKLEFERVQSFSKQDINSFSAASLITRSTNDVYHIQGFTARGLQISVKAPIMAVWALSKINAGAFEWTAVTAIALIILVVVIILLVKLNFPFMKRIQWLMDGVNRSTRENLEGLRVIRAYNAEGYQQEKFDRANEDLLKNNLTAVRIMAPLHPISSSLMNFLTLAIYWIGAGIIVSTSSQAEQMTLFSDMIVFTTYATQVVMSVMMLTGIFRGLPRAMVSASRIEEVIEHEPAIRDGPGVGDTEQKGTVEFRDVAFSYGDDREVVSDISFKVEAGQTFAIIGPTGSGKTSLVNLIPRMYEATSGSVMVDGHDVKEYGLRELRSRIGYMPQSAVIFSGSVKENVNYGEGANDRSEDDIRRALDIAQASSFVDSMPEGMDSFISQHGRNVSGGQKQRISIARAVCREPEIYIFDDTFSALDYRTDRDLRAALKRETSGHTTIIVAQRIGTIMDADRIIVLENGRIVGDGDHASLMNDCPLYREIAESQLSEGSE